MGDDRLTECIIIHNYVKYMHFPNTSLLKSTLLAFYMTCGTGRMGVGNEEGIERVDLGCELRRLGVRVGM